MLPSSRLVQPQEDNEEEDHRILPSDNLLVVGRAEEEFSSVEVHGRLRSMVGGPPLSGLMADQRGDCHTCPTACVLMSFQLCSEM